MKKTPKPQIRQKTGSKKLRSGCDPSVGAATQFKPGQSGNPGGRPKRKWLTEVVEEMLEEKLSDPREREKFKATTWEKLCSSRMVSAITLERTWERTEGKLTQPVEIGGEVNITAIIEEGRKRAEESA